MHKMVRIRLTQVNFKGHQMGSVIRVNKSEAKTLIKWKLAVEEPEEPTEGVAIRQTSDSNEKIKKKRTPRSPAGEHPSTEGNVKMEE